MNFEKIKSYLESNFTIPITPENLFQIVPAIIFLNEQKLFLKDIKKAVENSDISESIVNKFLEYNKMEYEHIVAVIIADKIGQKLLFRKFILPVGTEIFKNFMFVF